MTKKFNVIINGELQETKIDFCVMGLDDITSDFLNWCMRKRNNLEFIKQCNTMELISTSAVLHFDHLKTIRRIDDALKHERA